MSEDTNFLMFDDIKDFTTQTAYSPTKTFSRARSGRRSVFLPTQDSQSQGGRSDGQASASSEDDFEADTIKEVKEVMVLEASTMTPKVEVKSERKEVPIKTPIIEITAPSNERIECHATKRPGQNQNQNITFQLETIQVVKIYHNNVQLDSINFSNNPKEIYNFQEIKKKISQENLKSLERNVKMLDLEEDRENQNLRDLEKLTKNLDICQLPEFLRSKKGDATVVSKPASEQDRIEDYTTPVHTQDTLVQTPTITMNGGGGATTCFNFKDLPASPTKTMVQNTCTNLNSSILSTASNSSTMSTSSTSRTLLKSKTREQNDMKTNLIPDEEINKLISCQRVEYKALVYAKYGDGYWYPGKISSKIIPDPPTSRIEIFFLDDNTTKNLKKTEILRCNFLPVDSRILYWIRGSFLRQFCESNKSMT